MTHLVLTQQTNTAEQVEGTCINDLYALTVGLTLDNTSNITGKINAAAATKAKIEALHSLDANLQPVESGNTGRWDNLFATASAYAVEFADAEVRRVMESLLGKTLITTQDIQGDLYGQGGITTLPQRWFYTNQNVGTFDEFELFTKLPSALPGYMFEQSTLTSVRFPNHITDLGANCLYKCKHLRFVRLPDNLTTLYNCGDCYSVIQWVFPPRITQFGSIAVTGLRWGDSGTFSHNTRMVFLLMLAPSATGMDGTTFEVPDQGYAYNIYVPNDSLSAYLSHSFASGNTYGHAMSDRIYGFDVFWKTGSAWVKVTTLNQDMIWNASYMVKVPISSTESATITAIENDIKASSASFGDYCVVLYNPNEIKTLYGLEE